MTIAEVSKRYDITPDTLRYYERIGLIPAVPRTAGGIRDYDDVSCEWIDFLKRMRSAGVQIDALIDYVALLRQGDETQEQRKALLLEQREALESRISDMQQALDRLNCKLEWYERCSVPNEQRIRQLEAQRKG